MDRPEGVPYNSGPTHNIDKRAVKKTTVRSVAYLSGAPRVSTRPDASATGPRAHVLSFIHALERLGWNVITYIVGDRVPKRWVVKESRALFGGYGLKTWVADGIRMALSVYHLLWVRKRIGKVAWVYERMGLFQALGWPFKRAGVPWVLEVNARFSVEERGEKTFGSQRLVERWETWLFHQADLLVVVSNVLRDALVEIGSPTDKILVLPNAVDVHRYNPNHVRPIRIFSQPTVGFVGTMYPWQGLDRLI
ncbi:MAG: glycosyltransferase, partial [Candidatus Hydrothermae bacterium]|nr:glycosyltransferase [Candidatus Hydrothermae bacterium]